MYNYIKITCEVIVSTPSDIQVMYTPLKPSTKMFKKKNLNLKCHLSLIIKFYITYLMSKYKFFFAKLTFEQPKKYIEIVWYL